MTTHQIVYLVFGIVLVLALVFDLGLLSKKKCTDYYQASIKANIFLGNISIGVFCVYVGGRRTKTRIRILECLPNGMELKY